MVTPLSSTPGFVDPSKMHVRFQEGGEQDSGALPDGGVGEGTQETSDELLAPQQEGPQGNSKSIPTPTPRPQGSAAEGLTPETSTLMPEAQQIDVNVPMPSFLSELRGTLDTDADAVSDTEAMVLEQMALEGTPTKVSGPRGALRPSVLSSILREQPGDNLPSSSGFVNPMSNPNVRQEVRNKYAGKHVPASIRLNNMGAVSIVGKIEGSFAARQAGFVKAVKRPKNEGGYYAQYATPEHGVAAASNLLKRYGTQGTNTASKITRKWAAEPGNYPNVLVKYLNQAGFNVNKDSPLNLSDPKTRLAILKAKSAHESGFGRPVYEEGVFLRGVGMT